MGAGARLGGRARGWDETGTGARLGTRGPAQGLPHIWDGTPDMDGVPDSGCYTR